jgi:multiple sugar transport system permease protein
MSSIFLPKTEKEQLPVDKEKKSIGKDRRGRDKAVVIALFLLPAFAGLVIFYFFPLVTAVRNSFYNINLLNIDNQTFAGLDNYTRLVADKTFLNSLGVTLKYAGLKLGIQVPLAFLLAMLCYKPKRGIGFVRSSIFAPTVTATSIVAIIWTLMLHPTNGLINSFLVSLGFPAQLFLTSGSQALPSVVTMSIWQDVGFTMLIFLGGLQSIPIHLLEAADIDGASAIQRTWYVTLPLLKRTILYAMLTTTVFSFKVFTLIYVSTEGGPFNSTKVAVYYIWEQGFLFLNMGYASALAIILIIVLVLVALVQNKLLQPSHEY